MVVRGIARIFWNSSSNMACSTATPTVIEQKRVFLSSLNAVLIVIVSRDKSWFTFSILVQNPQVVALEIVVYLYIFKVKV